MTGTATLSVNELLLSWADRVIEVWTERMVQLEINNPYTHAQSFAHEIISSANGDVAKIEFAFEYFLKFTDMGVGKGISVANRANKEHNRKKKQWFNKTFLLEVRKLSNMLAAMTAHNGVLYVKEAIKG